MSDYPGIIDPNALGDGFLSQRNTFVVDIDDLGVIDIGFDDIDFEFYELEDDYNNNMIIE